MRRHASTLVTLAALLAAVTVAPGNARACVEPFPPNVGVSLESTPTGFDLTLWGGSAFGSPMGAGCGCVIALPLNVAFKLGCSITSAAITDPDGNDVGFGALADNATTASTFSSYFSPAFDPGTFNVFGFAGTLSNAITMGTSLKITFAITCSNPSDPNLRAAVAGILAHSAVVGTGPVMPDGSIETGDPTHLGVTTASVNDKCQAKKKLCVAKKQQCLLGCHAKAEAKGLAVDGTCLAKCTAKFDGGVNPAKGCFAKLEAKGGCIKTGDTAAAEAIADAYVTNVVSNVDPGYPTPVLSACAAAKKKCAAQKAAALLKCHSKAEAKGKNPDPNCLAKPLSKFVDCFTKAEAKADCLVTGDAAAIEAIVDGFVSDAVCEIDPAACP